MYFKHTHRPGFLLGLIDFCTAGLFFLLYMPPGGQAAARNTHTDFACVL